MPLHPLMQHPRPTFNIPGEPPQPNISAHLRELIEGDHDLTGNYENLPVSPQPTDPTPLADPYHPQMQITA